MSYTPQSHVAFGDMWPAGSHNIMLDNIAYLKSQADLLFLTVRNNDASTINLGDPIVLDPSYTSGLAVKMPTAANDLRAFGVVVSTSIASGASGIVAIGGTIQSINVTGAVIFGHSLVTSATAHYAQDSGGGGWGPGVLGFALAAQASGTGTISALISPYPLFYTAAQTIVRNQTKNPPTTTIAITNAISDGTNRLLLLFDSAYTTENASAAVFSGSGFTTLQNSGSTGKVYFSYLLASALATANITHSGTNADGLAAVIVLNGVNQTTPVGTSADANGTSVSPSVVVACSPGDLVIAGFGLQQSLAVCSGRGGGQTNILDIVGGTYGHLVVDYVIATGTSVTFTWTIASSVAWNAVGVAVKSA